VLDGKGVLTFLKEVCGKRDELQIKRSEKKLRGKTGETSKRVKTIITWDVVYKAKKGHKAGMGWL